MNSSIHSYTILIILILTSSCSIKKLSINYHSSNDNWDEYISNYSSNLPDYIKFNLSDKINNSITYTHSVKKENLHLLNNKGNLDINFKKLSFSTKFKFDEVYILGVYKVTLNSDNLIIIEWRNRYSVGRALNNVKYSVIDLTKEKLHFFSGFNSRVLCFTDVDGDNKIDFIQIDATDYYSKIPFEASYTEVYHFTFKDFDKNIIKNMRQNIYVIDCLENGYENMSLRDINNVQENPCL